MSFNMDVDLFQQHTQADHALGIRSKEKGLCVFLSIIKISDKKVIRI